MFPCSRSDSRQFSKGHDGVHRPKHVIHLLERATLRFWEQDVEYDGV